jgi:2-dehydro-3-deoxyglucarate aldolase/4-hydroxy-2-oxoheptanedioate aldolase
MSRNLKRMLAEKKRTAVFYLGHLCDPKIIDLLGAIGGWDAVWLDQEHAGLSIEMIGQCARAARAADLDCFVRLTATDYATVMRPLEAGAGGIMAAQIRTPAEAAKVIEWAKFWPQGLRGVNSTGVDGRFGTMSLANYMRQANESTYVIIQIEHAEAVENVEAIAALPNLDALFIGPADLSQSMGLPGETDHPKVLVAIERVAAACRKANIAWAILPKDVAVAKRCIELGCSMLSVGGDNVALVRGLRGLRDEWEWLRER